MNTLIYTDVCYCVCFARIYKLFHKYMYVYVHTKACSQRYTDL